MQSACSESPYSPKKCRIIEKNRKGQMDVISTWPIILQKAYFFFKVTEIPFVSSLSDSISSENVPVNA